MRAAFVSDVAEPHAGERSHMVDAAPVRRRGHPDHDVVLEAEPERRVGRLDASLTADPYATISHPIMRAVASARSNA